MNTVVDNKLVSFLVVNWNGRELLSECLDAIFNQSYSPIEVVVVDNGSTDGSVEFLSRYYPDVKVVPLSRNEGFAGGNNKGLSSCRGAYLALVNNDVVLDCNWVQEMVLPMAADAGIGLCSSRIFVKGTPRLDSAGDCFTTAFTGMKLGENEMGADYNRPLKVHGVCAAAALYRKSMIDQIGFFDEDLFLNYEDTDLNLRAWLRGWRCAYVPSALCEHEVNATIGKMSPVSVFYFSRNSLLVLLKNIPWRLIVRRFPQRLLFELMALLYYGIWHRRLITYIRGKWAALNLLRATLAKRRAMIGAIRLTDGEILQGQVPILCRVIERGLRLLSGL